MRSYTLRDIFPQKEKKNIFLSRAQMEVPDTKK